MRLLGISMRMEVISYPNGSQEIRNALADDWRVFLARALPNAIIAPIPNWGERTAAFLAALDFGGFIMSGGDDWGRFPLRDETETLIFNYARQKRLPVLGVCRGAQLVNMFCGGQTRKTKGGHARTRHKITAIEVPGAIAFESGGEVNSYHNLCVMPDSLAGNLDPWAIAEDGSVEAFACPAENLWGIMWHPERESEARDQDIKIFNSIFTRRES